MNALYSGRMHLIIAQTGTLSEITSKDILLLLVGIMLGGLFSWYASCVVGRYLYFRQILDQARAYVINTAGVLKPASLADRQGIVLGASAVISGMCGQLVTHGHKTAADLIKTFIDVYTVNLYAALKEMHELGPKLNLEQQIEFSTDFKDWLTLQNGAYMLVLANAKPSKRVLLCGFRSERVDPATALFTFEIYRKLTPEQKKPKKQ